METANTKAKGNRYSRVTFSLAGGAGNFQHLEQLIEGLPSSAKAHLLGGATNSPATLRETRRSKQGEAHRKQSSYQL